MNKLIDRKEMQMKRKKMSYTTFKNLLKREYKSNELGLDISKYFYYKFLRNKKKELANYKK